MQNSQESSFFNLINFVEYEKSILGVKHTSSHHLRVKCELYNCNKFQKNRFIKSTLYFYYPPYLLLIMIYIFFNFVITSEIEFCSTSPLRFLEITLTPLETRCVELNKPHEHYKSYEK